MPIFKEMSTVLSPQEHTITTTEHAAYPARQWQGNVQARAQEKLGKITRQSAVSSAILPQEKSGMFPYINQKKHLDLLADCFVSTHCSYELSSATSTSMLALDLTQISLLGYRSGPT